MPLRDDYEIEYDQEAEKLISGLSVNYDDEDIEIEMKRAHVDMYVRKLRERQRRKKHSSWLQFSASLSGRDKKDKERERPGGAGGVGGVGGVVGLGGGTTIILTGSLGSSVAATPKRKITKEEKEQRTKLRGLCQFMPQREFEEFFDNMHKERMLRAKVRELQRYRRNGITRLDESAEYERHVTNGKNGKRTKVLLGRREVAAVEEEERLGLEEELEVGLAEVEEPVPSKRRGRTVSFQPSRTCLALSCCPIGRRYCATLWTLVPHAIWLSRLSSSKITYRKGKAFPRKAAYPATWTRCWKNGFWISCRRAAGYPEKPPNYTVQRFGCKNNDCKYIFLLFYIASQKSLWELNDCRCHTTGCGPSVSLTCLSLISDFLIET